MARFIYVLGPSYCGSTLLSGLLDTVPGVASPGEMHWLLDSPGEGDGCTTHGASCSFLARLDRRELTSENLYQRCADALETETLVSTDKRLGHAIRFLPCGQADGILLVKSPEAMVASMRRHLPALTFAGARELYAATYEHLTLFLHNGFFRRGIALEYEELAKDPQGALQGVCAQLGLPAPQALQFPRPEWHNIGGNVPVYTAERYATQRVLRDDRWQSELTLAEQTAVRYDSRVSTAYRLARSAHH
jgi:hypothetical protein